MTDDEVKECLVQSMTARVSGDKDLQVALLATIPREKMPLTIVHYQGMLMVMLGAIASCLGLPAAEAWSEMQLAMHRLGQQW